MHIKPIVIGVIAIASMANAAIASDSQQPLGAATTEKANTVDQPSLFSFSNALTKSHKNLSRSEMLCKIAKEMAEYQEQYFTTILLSQHVKELMGVQNLRTEMEKAQSAISKALGDKECLTMMHGDKAKTRRLKSEEEKGARVLAEEMSKYTLEMFLGSLEHLMPYLDHFMKEAEIK
ncbi:hypothetical protein B0J14DRAFT_651245 [Halenospora varia]|nr:hypothetical protein B0J14DRAFT_651245 [Halenospora varia]